MADTNQSIRKRRRRRPDRRGATVVELAIVLLVFLTLVFGMLDLGMGVFRYHLLAQSARQGARQAIVHGSMANRLGSWGPTSYSAHGDDAAAIATYIRPMLEGFDLSQVTIQAAWIDGGNKPEQRVRVTLTAPYQPVMAFIFGSTEITLRATSTMTIAH
jgi:Flp pilus assembly protein TadG